MNEPSLVMGQQHPMGMSVDEPELVDDATEESIEEARAQALTALTTLVKGMRDEAIEGRRQSGIEEVWQEDQDMYEGVDAANQEEALHSRTRKPSATSGSSEPRPSTKSTVVLNIARPYSDAGSARISDMLMPVDDQPWKLEHSPIPEIPGVDKAEVEKVAKERAKKGSKRILDWLLECDWHGQVRLLIDDAARLGSGVLKGPVPVLRRKQVWKAVQGAFSLLVNEERISPKSKRISCWNLFPDPSCGQNIHNGAYIWEVEQYWSRKELMKHQSPVAASDGWLPDQIAEVLKEQPKYLFETNMVQTTVARNDYEIWHGHVTIDAKTIADAGLALDMGEERLISAYVILCNDRIIKVAHNPDVFGSFPYDVFPWSERDNMPWGRGIVRQVRTPQRIVTAATRNMMDNAGASSGVMLFMQRAGIHTNNGKGWLLNGNPTYEVDEGVDLSRAVRSFEIPSRQAELLSIINFGLKMAEDVTGLPMLLQGQQGKAPDTVGGMNLLNNNANGVLRRMARLFDGYITEPHIRRYNAWLQEYSQDPSEVGDFDIIARGSSALVERDIQNQAIFAMAQFVNDPEFRIKKDKWFAEWSKSQRLDPTNFQYDDAEWAEIEKNRQAPAPEPQVQAALIRKEAAIETTRIAETEETRRTFATLAQRREEALMELIADEKLSREEIKARLMDIVTKDRRERDIFAGQKLVKARYGTSVDMPG